MRLVLQIAPRKEEGETMARYIDAIDVPLGIEDAFDYLADFSRTAEWDPGVASASLLTGGPPRLGVRTPRASRHDGRQLDDSLGRQHFIHPARQGNQGDVRGTGRTRWLEPTRRPDPASAVAARRAARNPGPTRTAKRRTPIRTFCRSSPRPVLIATERSTREVGDQLSRRMRQCIQKRKE